MHPHFAEKFYGKPIRFIAADPDTGTRIYYSAEGDRMGYTRPAAERGSFIHYSATDVAVGSTNTVRTADPSHPAVQVHKDAKGSAIGYTKRGAFGNDRKNKKRNHFSAQDKAIGSTMSGVHGEEMHFGSAGNLLPSPSKLGGPTDAQSPVGKARPRQGPSDTLTAG